MNRSKTVKTAPKAKDAGSARAKKTPAGKSASPPPVRQTKSALLRKMLVRKDGASIADLCDATGWQAHSVRAALSGLRKAGCEIERRPAAPGAGGGAYRLITAARPEARA